MTRERNAHADGRVGGLVGEKYRLERLLGAGGMASVYAAVHERNGYRVAIKVLHPMVAADAASRARFLREGYVGNKVDHPGAVRVIDDGVTDDGATFLVMELLEGESVAAYFERRGRSLPPAEVCEIALAVLDVLAAAHAKGIVHRDIKPDNLFRTRDGRIKVLDFGIARLREANAPSSATQTGLTMGTPAFMPPEQALARSREIDGQTDLWAVGATMFALISGQFVHAAESAPEMLIRAASERARPLASVAPQVPAPVAAVIDRALAFEKIDRWPSAQAMAEALARADQAAYGQDLDLRRSPSRPAGLPLRPQAAADRDPAPGRVETAVAPGSSAFALHPRTTTGAVSRPSSEPEARGAPPRPNRRGAVVALGALTLIGVVLVGSRLAAPRLASKAAAGESGQAQAAVDAAGPAVSIPDDQVPATVLVGLPAKTARTASDADAILAVDAASGISATSAGDGVPTPRGSSARGPVAPTAAVKNMPGVAAFDPARQGPGRAGVPPPSKLRTGEGAVAAPSADPLSMPIQ